MLVLRPRAAGPGAVGAGGGVGDRVVRRRGADVAGGRVDGLPERVVGGACPCRSPVPLKSPRQILPFRSALRLPLLCD